MKKIKKLFLELEEEKKIPIVKTNESEYDTAENKEKSSEIEEPSYHNKHVDVPWFTHIAAIFK